ncbi:peptide chain release factor N(5)-glutamine methyltransferase [Thiomonas sp.]|jgi:release factor glutamine methyltransferase|uniref:peptide chain release factor N(5)-glutamine methyltransferase n=1 Tax=Thiomonas sp. TaxID=2047785 RepID=UPI0026210AFA|nr:peptide chain release factor N(5)-glutamine methyltransferase [Thiomonas sp.]
MNAVDLPLTGLQPDECDALGIDGVLAFQQRLALLAATLQTVPDKPEETPAAALRTLWHCAGGQPLSLHAASETALPPLDTAALQRLDDLLARRTAGEPLAYLVGRQRFMGLDLLASPAALIPRAETEMLATVALHKLAGRDAPVVLDVCCGSGNLALALADNVADAQVHGADISPEAIALARDNAAHTGLASRVQWHVGDLMQPVAQALAGQVDLIVSAPPYISTARMATMPAEIIGFEPDLAFDGGPFGVRILMRLIREAPPLLRPGGWLAIEVGLGQGDAMVQLLHKHPGYDGVETVCDTGGAVRVVAARACGG